MTDDSEEDGSAELLALLERSEQMAALGLLLAGVAHEVSTPIGAVKSGVDVQRRGLQKLEAMIEEAESIEELRSSARYRRLHAMLTDSLRVVNDAAGRVSRIASSLKSFARRDTEEGDVDLIAGIESTLDILGHKVRNDVTVRRELDPVPAVRGVASELYQVLLNVIDNAIGALEGGGTVTVRTVAHEDVVEVQVQDDGVGIPTEHLERIFEAGFTTKARGTGTGLGLAIVRKIVERHGGEVRVQSQPGVGSTFTVTLPRA